MLELHSPHVIFKFLEGFPIHFVGGVEKQMYPTAKIREFENQVLKPIRLCLMTIIDQHRNQQTCEDVLIFVGFDVFCNKPG